MAIIHWQASSAPPPIALDPRSQQHLPLYYRPVWEVGHLVYQGGIPFLPPAPLNGGGFIPYRSPPAGKEAPGWQNYVTPISSAVGGGSMPSRPNFLMRLLGGLTSSGQ